MRRSFSPCFFSLLVLALAERALAQQIGDTVVVVSDKVEVKLRDEVIYTTRRGEIFEVREVQRELIGIHSRHGTGFIEKRQVIPLSQAVAHWSGVIRSNPQDAAAYVARGLAYVELEDFDKAIADYSEAIRLDPKDALAYSNRGLVWFYNDDADKAIADYNEAIRLDPKYALAYFNRGDAWSRKGDPDMDMAIADYNEAIRLDPKDAWSYYYRGLVWYRKGEPAKAITDHNEAIRLDPKFHYPHNARAWIWATSPDAQLRDGKKAVESATRACELQGWVNHQWIATLAAAYAEAGDFEAAVRWQTNAMQLAPERDKANYLSRLNLYQSGKPYRQEPKK